MQGSIENLMAWQIILSYTKGFIKIFHHAVHIEPVLRTLILEQEEKQHFLL